MKTHRNRKLNESNSMDEIFSLLTKKYREIKEKIESKNSDLRTVKKDLERLIEQLQIGLAKILEMLDIEIKQSEKYS